MLQNSQMVYLLECYTFQKVTYVWSSPYKNLPFHLKIDRDTHIKLVDRLEAPARIIKS